MPEVNDVEDLNNKAGNGVIPAERVEEITPVVLGGDLILAHDVLRWCVFSGRFDDKPPGYIKTEIIETVFGVEISNALQKELDNQ